MYKESLLDKTLTYFQTPLIHHEVLKELVDSGVKNAVEGYIRSGVMQLVEDDEDRSLDKYQKVIWENCKRELENRFDIQNGRDLGEYRTLMYSKMNSIIYFATQEMAIHQLYLNSVNFSEHSFITMQDLSFLLSQDGESKVARYLYKRFTNTYHYPRHEFMSFATELNKKHVDFEASYLRFIESKDR